MQKVLGFENNGNNCIVERSNSAGKNRIPKMSFLVEIMEKAGMTMRKLNVVEHLVGLCEK